MSALLCAQILRVCRETPTVRLPDAVRASEVWLQHGRRLPNLGGWPARHRRDAQAHYCKMSLKELPEELCSLMATLLPRNDLLALRQCNKSSAAAVQRSIQDDERFEKMIFDALAEPRNIESEGRIFGGGARELVSFCAADAALPALQSAITETAGGLQKLCLYRCAVTDARLLEMCRACPLLQTLVCVIDVPNIETADVEQLSMQISQACPLLEVVKLPCNGSAVEGYAAAFPNLRCLEFFSHGHGSHAVRKSKFHSAVDASAEK